MNRSSSSTRSLLSPVEAARLKKFIMLPLGLPFGLPLFVGGVFLGSTCILAKPTRGVVDVGIIWADTVREGEWDGFEAEGGVGARPVDGSGPASRGLRNMVYTKSKQ